MRIIGCDLHARQQTVAMLDTTTGEVVNAALKHEGIMVREFYGNLPRPARVGIEATGSMQWFVNLLEELGIECLVGHPATIRAAEPRKQKHDRRDADLLLSLLAEERFPAIWLPTKELLDLRALLRHRHQWVSAGQREDEWLSRSSRKNRIGRFWASVRRRARTSRECLECDGRLYPLHHITPATGFATLPSACNLGTGNASDAWAVKKGLGSCGINRDLTKRRSVSA
jgi:transposase